MFGRIGPVEIFFIFLVLLLLFGARRIPEIARSLGKALREFKKGVRDAEREVDVSTDPDAPADPGPDPGSGDAPGAPPDPGGGGS